MTSRVEASSSKLFRICPSRDKGRLLHGSWHPDAETDPEFRVRYVCIMTRDGDRLAGYLSPENFTAVMRALVSSDYDTPNWCEKCHLAGHDGCCRCEIACNE